MATPPIVLLGTAGNLLCVIIMMRRHYRSISTGVYLFCLALADTMFLYMNSMVMNFTRLTFDFDFRTVSVATCKIYIYLLMTSKCLSAWFIVAVTVERLLAITFPLKANVLATRKRAWLVVGGFCAVLGAIYLLPVFTYTHIEHDWWIGCDMAPHHKKRNLDIVLKFLDLVLHTLLPSLTLFICNILLVRELVHSKNLRNALSNVPLHSPSRRQRGPSRLTAMLLLLSGVFLLFNLPMSLYLLAASIDTGMPKRFLHWDLLYRIFYTLQITNSATNFPLYCLSGPLFRNQVVNLCTGAPCCPARSRRADYQLVSLRSGSTVSRSFRYEASPASTRSRYSRGDPRGGRATDRAMQDRQLSTIRESEQHPKNGQSNNLINS